MRHSVGHKSVSANISVSTVTKLSARGAERGNERKRDRIYEERGESEKLFF